MRERLDERSVDGEYGIEKVRQPDAMCFGDQAEERTVAVKTPRPSYLDDFKARFVVPVGNLAPT